MNSMEIRPISDLKNKFLEIKDKVKEGKPVYLTKNRYGSMVVLSIEQYSQLTEDIGMKLDKADNFANSTSTRLTQKEVFSNIKSQLNGQKL